MLLCFVDFVVEGDCFFLTVLCALRGETEEKLHFLLVYRNSFSSTSALKGVLMLLKQ